MKIWLRMTGALVVLLASLFQPDFSALVSAQSTNRARITRLDASAFPTIRITADVFREDGSFISGLSSDDIKVLENNIQRPADEVHETANGVGLVVAVNGGPIYANRITAQTHLQIIKDALLAWVPEAEKLGKDDSVTLVTNAGVKAANMATPSEWSAAFNTLSTDLIQAVPSLTSLTTAVEQAASAPLRPGMKRSILYITPLMSAGLGTAVENITEQAAGEGVQINVWLVAQGAARDSQPEQMINALAERTGGEVYRFTGREALPPIENYLQPLRQQYEILFRSRTNTSGAQIVAFEVQSDLFQARSQEENFEVVIKPPNIMFIDPPQKLALSWQKNASGGDELSPASIPLQIQIEFPDSHPRNLAVSQLQVDGSLMDERNSNPYDTFTWQLKDMKTSGAYSLQVTIKDELGLNAKTVVLPVEVDVPPPPPTLLIESISAGRLALAAGLVLLGIIFILLIRWDRISKLFKPARKPASTRVDSRPLDRKTTVIDLPRESSGGLNVQNRETTGWLLPIEGGDNTATQPSICLDKDITSIGSSPIRATVVIASPSVDGLHVRVLRKKGMYWLEDASSVSGTWINNTPVSNMGTALAAGDEIRLGKVKFRFELR